MSIETAKTCTGSCASCSSLQDDLKKGRSALRAGIFQENPVFCQILGVCSALAVTGKVANAVVMGVAVTFTAILGNAMIAAMRNIIPRRIRLIVEVIVIAFFVILFDQLLKAYWFDMSRELGPYVGLIITNCILMGRAEAYALQNRILPSMMDGLGNGLGYSIVLVVVAVIRELSGSGTLMAGTPLAIILSSQPLSAGTPCLLRIPIDIAPAQIMIMAPGAFFTIGVLIYIFGAFRKQEAK